MRFSARLNMETERDAFVCSLAKFTYLATIKGLQQKNIECIRLMLEIGLAEGNHLCSSWSYVLHCISHLERLQIVRTLKPDAHYFQEDVGDHHVAGDRSGFGGGEAATPEKTRTLSAGDAALSRLFLAKFSRVVYNNCIGAGLESSGT